MLSSQLDSKKAKINKMAIELRHYKHQMESIKSESERKNNTVNEGLARLKKEPNNIMKTYRVRKKKTRF